MLTGFMQFVSFLGSARFYLPVLVVVFWCVSPRAGARAAVLLAFGSVLNTLLKLLWHAPRPYWTDPHIKAREAIASFGMPSGHAQGAAVAWGLAGARARRRWFWALAVAVVFLVGVSRVHLGVHSVPQVLAGWAIGGSLLVLGLVLEPLVVPWWTRSPLVVQFLLSVLITVALLIPIGYAVESLDAWRIPEAWARAIEVAGGTIKPSTLTEAAGAAGTFFGVLTGLSWLARWGGFEAGGSPARRLARIPIGLSGASAIWVAGLFAGAQAPVVFVVHTLLALWATAGAPVLFVRLGLARRGGPPGGAAGAAGGSGDAGPGRRRGIGRPDKARAPRRF